MTVKLKNIYLALKDQLPLARFFRNFFITGHGRGLFSKRSHFTVAGKEKVSYGSKASAKKAAEKMQKKTGYYYSTYKCIFCDGHHLGRNYASHEAIKFDKEYDSK